MSNLNIHLIPILEDNYSFIGHDENSSDCFVIDPGSEEPINAFLEKHALKLKEILITHFHSDHIGGALALKEKHRCPITGPKHEQDKIVGIDKTVADLDMLSFSNHPYKVLEFPGHTMGHVGYWFFEDKALFCGDTLFSLGCGFLFEGSYQDMWNSLCKIRSLPEDTQIYCGHEYTQQNGIFAQSVDPENEHLKKYLEEVKQKREHNKPTLPFLLKNEMYINPFLRADLPIWEKKLGMHDAPAVKIFQKLREMKNKFKE